METRTYPKAQLSSRVTFRSVTAPSLCYVATPGWRCGTRSVALSGRRWWSSGAPLLPGPFIPPPPQKAVFCGLFSPQRMDSGALSSVVRGAIGGPLPVFARGQQAAQSVVHSWA